MSQGAETPPYAPIIRSYATNQWEPPSLITAPLKMHATLQLNVRKWTLMLCEALENDFLEESIKRQKFFAASGDNPEYHNARIESLKNGQDLYEFIIETGRKYHKIIMVTEVTVPALSTLSLTKKTGEVYMAASFKSPAKNGVRYDLRLIEDREFVLKNCDWAVDTSLQKKRIMKFSKRLQLKKSAMYSLSVGLVIPFFSGIFYLGDLHQHLLPLVLSWD